MLDYSNAQDKPRLPLYSWWLLKESSVRSMTHDNTPVWVLSSAKL